MKVNDHSRGSLVLNGKKEKGGKKRRESGREGGVREREMRRV